MAVGSRSSGAITDLALVEGKFAKQPIYANEPIIEVKLANKGKEVIIPDGFRVFDIVVRDETGGSGYLAPEIEWTCSDSLKRGNASPLQGPLSLGKH